MRLILDLNVSDEFDKNEEKLIYDLLFSTWGPSIPLKYKSNYIGDIKLDGYNWQIQGDKIEEITMNGRLLRK